MFLTPLQHSQSETGNEKMRETGNEKMNILFAIQDLMNEFFDNIFMGSIILNE